MRRLPKSGQMLNSLSRGVIVIFLLFILAVCGGPVTTPPSQCNSVSGTVTFNNIGVEGVLLSLSGSGQMAATKANGVFTFACVADGSYTITPSSICYTFDPPSRRVDISGSDVSGVNISAIPNPGQYAISGTVSTTYSAGVPTVEITLSGAAQSSTMTDGAGHYLFNVPNGPYVLTTPLTDPVLIFTPQSRTVSVCAQDAANQDFTASGSWIRSYGTAGDYEFATDLIETSDQGLLVAGYTTPDIYTGPYSMWLLKLSPKGDLLWQKAYKPYGPYSATAKSIRETADGGYIVAGSTGGGIWMLKINADGGVLWQRVYATADKTTGAYAVRQTPDGGYVVAGYQFDSSTQMGDDFLVLRIDADGNVIWQKSYNYSDSERAHSIEQTPDGGFIVVGEASSLTYQHTYNYAWILKIDANGDVLWQYLLGRPGFYDMALSIRRISSGGYIVGGAISGFWACKIDENGSILWQKTYQEVSSGHEYAAVQETPDGDFIAASGRHILKLNANGDELWRRQYYMMYDGYFSAVQTTSDGRYIAAGHSGSASLNINDDIQIVKIEPNGTIPNCTQNYSASGTVSNTTLAPMPTSAVVTATTPSIIITTAWPQTTSSPTTRVCP